MKFTPNPIRQQEIAENAAVPSSEPGRAERISHLVDGQMEFVKRCSNITTSRFLLAAAQLCHMDTELAVQVWLQMFPRLLDILDEQQRSTLTQEVLPFVASGTHIVQKDCHPSAMNVFVEALCRCNPPIQLQPPLMKYMGRSHNLWHRMVLGLEQMAFDPKQPASSAGACYDFEPDQTPKSVS